MRELYFTEYLFPEMDIPEYFYSSFGFVVNIDLIAAMVQTRTRLPFNDNGKEVVLVD